jgi:FkbM family methyltransferase
MSSAAPVTLRLPGLSAPLQMFVHGPQDKHVSQKISQDGVWEPYESSLVLSRLHSGSVFVDVGANIGYFTVIGASHVGEGGRVYAFEPDPKNFHLMEKNCALNSLQSCVHAVRAGLSNEDNTGQLYLSEDNLGDHQIYPSDGERAHVDIILRHGSRYLQRQLRRDNIAKIDLIKVDTQGSEFAVMAGLMPLLQSLDKVPTILIELTPYSLRQAGSSGRELIELLAQLQQDFWIVDHVEHQLVLSSAEALAQWCDNVDAVEGDEGFMNILVEDAAV